MPRAVLLCFGLVGVLLLSTCVRAGSIWPQPKFINYRKISLTLHASEFEFMVTNKTCDILKEAVRRYTDVVKRIAEATSDAACVSSHNVTLLAIQLTSQCEQWPQSDMKETYELHVTKDSAVLKSDTIWGILRGLESFAQILTPSNQLGCLVVNHTDVLDQPRFSHRGLLLDSSRHFLPVSIILNIISAMEMNKMNVFHWHITDDESFPYQSTTFPSLSEKGAYDSKKAIYKQEDVESIINYARLRGIRVLPEFDTPGHTLSWGKGTSKLLTACFTNGTFNGKFGPVDPSRQENYKFLESLMKEIKGVFRDNYIHLGGDEVSFNCWDSNPGIQNFMKDKDIKNSTQLEGYYFKKVFNILGKIGANGVVWEEVYNNNITLPRDTVVHNWYANRTTFIEEVTRKGLKVLSSQGWYLDNLNDTWKTFYHVDPTEFNGTQSQMKLVLGGEACMWGEMVDESNIVPRIWPRASAVAERLWSPKKVTDISAATPRLSEHVCRMKWRGVAAQPASGPGYCPY